MEALRAFGFGSPGLRAEDFADDAMIQLGQPPRRIDLLMSLGGVSFDDCYRRREVVEVGGVDMNFIGLDDFKANKRASGRYKDLADLESLED